MGVPRDIECRVQGILKVITNGVHYLSHKSVTGPRSPEKRHEWALTRGCDIRHTYLEILLNMVIVVKSY